VLSLAVLAVMGIVYGWSAWNGVRTYLAVQRAPLVCPRCRGRVFATDLMRPAIVCVECGNVGDLRLPRR
jgi:ribosomal protein L37AE/L43A